MREAYPLLLVGGIIGLVSVALIIAYASIKDKKQAIGFDRHMKDGEIVRRLLRYAKPFAGSFVLVGFVMLFGIAYDIVSPLIVGQITDLIREPFDPPALFRLVGIYAGILIVSMACTYAQAVILQKVGQKIISGLRGDLFTHILSLSHEQMNAIPVGKLVTRVTNDTNAISLMFTTLLVNLVKNFFVVIGVFVAMITLNYELTLMVLSFVPFIVLFTVIFRKFSRRAYRRVKDRTTDINTYLSENLSGIKITQIFNREKEKLRDFTEKSRGLGKAKREQILVFGIFRPLVYMLYISSVLCLFYLGGKGYLDGTAFLGQVLTAGTVVSFYMYINKFYTPIQNLAEQFNWLQSAFASAEKVFTVMDIEPAVTDAPDAVELDSVRGEIEFRDVWFRYVPDEWVLKGVSFHVVPDQTVAFVGATGSGKTTILSLICRNYEFQKGEILIDGIDIRKIKASSLRKHFIQNIDLYKSPSSRAECRTQEAYIDHGVTRALFQPGDRNMHFSRYDLGDNDDRQEREHGNNKNFKQLVQLVDE